MNWPIWLTTEVSMRSRSSSGRRGVADAGRFGEDARHLVLGGPAALGPLALGDVADDGEDDRPAVDLDEGGVDVHRDEAAVAGAVAALAGEAAAGELALQAVLEA